MGLFFDMIMFFIFMLSICAYGISAISGGGASLIMMPFLGLILSADLIPGSLTIGSLSGAISRIIVFWRHINWNVVKYYVPSSLVSVFFGVWMLSFLNPVYLNLLLGFFLLNNLPMMLFRSRRHDETHTNNLSDDAEDDSLDAERSDGIVTPVMLVMIGACSGFISGFSGAVGLVFNKFYSQLNLTKHEIIATRSMNDILLQVVKMILYIWFNLVTWQSFNIGIIIAISAIISSFLMKYVLPHMKDHIFHHVGQIATVVAGFAMIIISGHQIFVQNHDVINHVIATTLPKQMLK